jgi:hypothetical protein
MVWGSQLTAHADAHLQKYEQRKLGRLSRRDPDTDITMAGNTIIGNILKKNMALLPLTTNPFGHLGPIFRHFLSDNQPAVPLTFPPSRPNARKMYSRLMTYPSSKGILTLTDHNWKTSPTHRLFGHSYTSPPTPTIYTLQHLHLCLVKAFALHIRHATQLFSDHLATTTPAPTIPISSCLC